MYGVDITDGTKLWSFDTAYDSIRWASSSRDSIQLLENGVAISVDSTDGSEQWRFELPDTEIDGNNIFRTVNSLGVAYLTSPNAVYGLDAATGAVEWEFETTAKSSMAVDVTFDSTWMYISDAGTTFRVDPATGESDWSFDTSAEESELTVADSNGEDIYLIETGGDLRRIAPSGGSGGTGDPDGSTHPSGVSDNVFEAVDSDGDGDLSRVEVRDTVEGFIRDGEVDGVSIGRSDVRMLV
jgi:glucose dehydrogenase